MIGSATEEVGQIHMYYILVIQNTAVAVFLEQELKA